jgi:hypothetical protein
MVRFLAIVLPFFMLPSYADVSVNNLGKNDKISTRSLSSASNSGELPAVESNTKIDGRVVDNGVKALELRAEQWDFARNGESILLLPVLHQLLNTWLSTRDRKIEIQYPGGEEGEFWVQELADWLVALGIPSENLVLVAGSGVDDVIRFELIY